MTPKVLGAINRQIAAEFAASFSYLAMAAWCEHHKFMGAGQWLRLQSAEEHAHAMRLFDFVLARNHAWPEKMFGLVTGFMERDETPEEGVAREVQEELGLTTTSASLIGVYPFQRKNEIILAYHVVAEGEIVLNEELAEFRLIPPEKLRPWEFGTGLAIRDWLARRCP